MSDQPPFSDPPFPKEPLFDDDVHPEDVDPDFGFVAADGIGEAFDDDSEASAKQNDVVTAGAGTGKTYALVNDYVFALLGLDGSYMPRSPHRILAITFTDKAAAEMRSRVIDKVSRLVRSPKADPDVTARAEAIGASLPEPTTLQTQAKQLATAPISTFHSLCTSLLRDLALKARVDPAFTVLDDADERLLYEETAEAVVLDVLATEGAPHQAEVAELSARMSLRRMGRGRGLVDELVDRARGLAERGQTAREVRPVFDADAAEARLADPKDRCGAAFADLVAALEEVGNEGTLTLATQLERVSQDFLAALDKPSTDREAACAAHFERLADLLTRRLLRTTKDALPAAQGALADCGAALVDVIVAPHAEAFCALLVLVEDRVAREKQARGVLGFGDLLLKTRDLLRTQPRVRNRVKSRFDRILVDEYQDTSPVQEDIVALLAEAESQCRPVPDGQKAMGTVQLGRGRLFVVGDPKQSIYGFRGADARLFSHTSNVVVDGSDTTAKSGEPRTLRTSYRSRAPVCDVVNLVSDVLFAKTSDDAVPYDAGDALLAHRGGDGPAGALWRCFSNTQMPADLVEAFGIGRKLRTMLFPADGDDPLFVVDKATGDMRAAQPRDVAILVRRIRAAGPIARALTHNGIPVRITGGEGFFAREEVVDLLAVLRLVVEPGDDLATLTVLRSPMIGVEDDELLQVVQNVDEWRRGFSLADAVWAAEQGVVSARSAARIQRLVQVLDVLRELAPVHSAAHLLDVVIDELNMVEAMGVEPDALERMANFDKLRGMLDDTEGHAVASIQRMWSFLDAPPKEGVASALAADVDAVQIMTIHQAKGLEFPVVVLAELGTSLPRIWAHMPHHGELGIAVNPRGRPIEVCLRRDLVGKASLKTAYDLVIDKARQEQEAEMSRLLYVAMTRARDWLFLVGEERNSGDASFRRLVARTRTTFRKEFDTVMPTERVPAIPGPRRAVRASHIPPPSKVVPSPVVGVPRIVPSALTLHRQAGLAADTDLARARVLPHMARARARGRAAHHILSRVAESADFALIDDDERAHFAVRAIARACGLSAFDDDNERLFNQLVATVRGPLAALMRQGAGLRFEELIRYATPSGAVVQGAADLVARTPEWTLVVDFKSSAQGAASDDTHLQLCAYAEGLHQAGEPDVRLSAWALGEPEVSAKRYTDEDRRRLHDALAVALSDLDAAQPTRW